jgi:hypothetical protein
MALVKCPECTRDISEKAAACPHCGAPRTIAVPPRPQAVKPPAKHYGCGTLILVCAISFGVFHFATKGIQGALPPANTSTRPPLPASSRSPAEKWIYSTSPDEMGKGVVLFAILRSENSFRFDFPYQGEQRSTLTLRRHPRHGNDAIVTVEKGQLHCAYQACNWNIRFDEAPATAFTLSEPESRQSQVMFIRNFDRFYSELVKAKRVRIEAQFFQQPPVVLDFDVSGFDPTRLNMPPRK